jgi:hypothetical protein
MVSGNPGPPIQVRDFVNKAVELTDGWLKKGGNIKKD